MEHEKRGGKGKGKGEGTFAIGAVGALVANTKFRLLENILELHNQV